MSTDNSETPAGRCASVLRRYHLRVMGWFLALTAVCLAMPAGVAAERQPPVDVHQGPGSTLHGYNGTCPESPDGKRLVYLRVSEDRKRQGEIWIANTDLTGHRMVCKAVPESRLPHNGAMSSWVDNRRVAFRCNGSSTAMSLSVVDVDADGGTILHGPIYGKIGHYATGGKLPFVVQTDQQVEQNAKKHPVIDETGLYTLDCDTGKVAKVLTRKHLVAHWGQKPLPKPAKELHFGHAMHNPSGTRLSVSWGKGGGGKALLSCDLNGGAIEFAHPGAKPLHYLWYDDETYLGVKKGIWRFTQNGKPLERLGGKGNHIDISPDRQWTVTDPGYGGVPVEIKLYARGQTEPTAILASHTFGGEIWKQRAHANPVFSRDGRHVYFLHVFEKGVVRLVRVPVPGAGDGG